MRTISIIASVALLAACSSSEEPAANKTQTVQQPVPPKPAEPRIEQTVAYPVAFEGRWGLVPGDCVPGASDAKGLMQVEGATLRFYEARATTEKLLVENGTKAAGELAFSGEGERWTKSVTLSLEDGGKTLARSEPDLPKPLRYAKCEG